MTTEVHARRDAIRRLIRSQVIATQEELGKLLEKDGIEVTQATLSRDLGALAARRIQLAEGGTAYELDDAPVSGGVEGLKAVHALVTTVDESDAMVVLHTRPGAASIVAAAIDAGRPSGVLGTIAGDDTIFIVPSKGIRPARVANQLRTVWKKGEGMSSVVAKTEASGGVSLDPQVLRFSTSLQLDRRLLKEDLLGSLAHIAMLARQKLVPDADARAIQRGLVKIWEDAAAGALQLPDEEDVHMAVEVELHRRIGAAAQVLHTARSRNDQVATDLRLWLRHDCARVLAQLAGLVQELAAYARQGATLVLPAYTHRQRAQPISLAYWWASWATGLLRDAEAFEFVLSQVDTLALGVGAISGTSLKTDRESVRVALKFSRLTSNGLDTVGDRDFALDYLYAATRLLLRLGRLSTDLIDFSSREFGFVSLGGEIACGSSMMPQKRNPDVFELLRGKSGTAIGALTGLLSTVKGLPGGYNRDLQEDRGPLLEMSDRLEACLSVLRLALRHVKFDADRCRAALEDGGTQATDLAEALVRKGVAFREAYQAVGKLVRFAGENGVTLRSLSPAQAAQVDARFDAAALAALEPRAAAAAKASIGGTGDQAVAVQLDALEARAKTVAARAAALPTAESLFSSLKENWP